ncbi:Receptor-like protein EIX2 [Glycine soja]
MWELNLAFCLHGVTTTETAIVENGKAFNTTMKKVMGNDLQGQIPYQPGKIIHLKYLDLSTNDLHEIKCIESERQALLNFKHGLIDKYGMLSTWRDDNTNRDCCKWKGIQCNNQTGHVEMLHLRGQDTQYLSGAINISSLIALEKIEHLDLSYNAFQDISISLIPELMGSFTNLRYLYLSDSLFGGSIPSDIGKLTHLLSLDLSDNDLHGKIPYQLGNLTHLQYLDLSDSDLDGELPYQLGNLSQLRYLDLRGNSFSGALPFQVGNLPLLHTLGLGGNFDGKSKDAEWLTKLSSLTKLKLSSLHNLSSSHHWLQMISKLIPNLRELRLFDCSLSDTNIQSLFYSPSNFSTALTILDLSSNRLTSSTFQLLSNFSHHLQELYLPYNNIVLSSPLCPNFPSLVILDLSYNNLTSSVFQGSFNFSSKLQNLYLQNCSLTDGSFLMSSFIMSSSSSLVSLGLSSNLLKSSTIFDWLFNSTTNLHNLFLYDNMLEGPISDGFGKVMNSLEGLYLYGNKLQGEIPSFFGNMCALQSLDLSNNKLNGEISSFFQNSSWCNRYIFKSLYLSYNRLTSMLPKSIGLLSELTDLYLAGNSLEGDVTESHLSNFSKLELLSLSENSLSLKLVPSWVPPFQLKYLAIRSCKLGPTFPSWLKTQSSLRELDISDNGINDSVPDWFWNNLQYMRDLNMSFNYLIGSIPNISLKLRNGPSVLLNTNQFEGKIPSFLLQASVLILSENNFSDLFSFLCDQSTAANLATLDGQLPDCWKSVKQLVFLDLSSNKLSGKIPMSMGALVNMEALVLRNNGLMGELPSSLKNCTSLFMLNLSENMLSGPIPSWIGESMHQLIILNMRGNHLSGNLPIHLCYLKRIQLLDLSRNNLSSGIPSCLKNLTALPSTQVTLSHIYWNDKTSIVIYGYTFRGYTLDITWMWKGVERGFKDPELELKSMDLSCNNLMGEIPKEIGYLLGLVSLNLSRNNLSGEIPSQIGNLGSLESLDLSRNHISGRIPSSLSEIDDLGKLDLSHNSLSGRIPSGRHFETFEASSFEGNIDLCGEQLNKTCPGDGDQTTEEGQEPPVKGDDSVFYEGLYMSLGIGYFTGFWGLLGPLLLWRPWRIAYIRFLNRLTDYLNLAFCLHGVTTTETAIVENGKAFDTTMKKMQTIFLHWLPCKILNIWSIPSELGKLSHLRYFDLGDNLLYGEIPHQLGKLTHLRYLDLRSNDLQGQIPYQPGKLIHLKYLDLSTNDLHGSESSYLHTLRLAGNFDLKSKDAERLSNLSSLTNLDFNSLHDLNSSRNWLQMITKPIQNLRELRLVDCSLSDNDHQYADILNISSELYLSSKKIVLSSSLYSSFPSLIQFKTSKSLFRKLHFTIKFRTLDHSDNMLQGSILGFNSLPNSAEIKCIESERQALLNFTHGLIDDSGMLSTWRDDDTNRDCCKWKGIQCNNQTGHVETLHLRGQDTQYLIGEINISSFISLENIEHLDLSYNSFQGSHIPELMGSFTNLRYLNLSDSLFGGSIPSDLGKLTHLLSLDLGNNYLLQGQIPYQLGNLTHLQYLDLSGNYLDGELPYLHIRLPTLFYGPCFSYRFYSKAMITIIF